MNAHFFDIDTVILSDAKIWVVDKQRPSVCLVKVDQSDFNLIRNGVYRSHGNRVQFAGVDYYLPDELMDRIKLSAKRLKADTSNLAFSMREFIDPEHIGSVNHTVDIDVIRSLKNTQDDVYFICSRNTKKSYDAIVKKVEDKLESLGISPKYYYVSETFYDRDEDETTFDKVRLLLQHLIGLRTDGRKFTDEQVTRYDEIHFYDEDGRSVQVAIGVSDMLSLLVGNSESSTKDLVKQVLKDFTPTLYVSLVTPNKINRLSTKKVVLENSRLVRTFESYRFFTGR